MTEFIHRGGGGGNNQDNSIHHELFSLLKLKARNLESVGESNAVSLSRAVLSEDLQVDVRVDCLINAGRVKTLMFMSFSGE